MSQEATMIAVDNSDYMRNEDFFPSRLEAQNEAVSLICQSRRQRNPENTVGLLSLANTEVLCTLTGDVSKIYNRLHVLEPKGNISFCSSIRIAHLALRHRQVRHQKMRVVCFVGSPINDDSKELVKLAKRLRKEKVNIDIINFGENEVNQEKLAEFIDTLNGKEGTGSHLVSVVPGTVLHDSLVTSPIISGEDGLGMGGAGLGMEFGIDGAEDPDLLYALRVSMEDQRMRQEHEVNAGAANPPTTTATLPVGSGTSEEAMLQQALQMSMQMENPGQAALPMDVDFDSMSEADQIAYALRISMQQVNPNEASNKMDLDQSTSETVSNSPAVFTPKGSSNPVQASGAGTLNLLYDPDFLESVLKGLPGVDVDNEEVLKVINAFTKSQSKNKDTDDKDDKQSDDQSGSGGGSKA